MNAATNSTRPVPVATFNSRAIPDPAVAALDQYRVAADLVNALTAAREKGIERGERPAEDSQAAEARAEYCRSWQALGEVEPTSWRGVVGLLDILADEVEAGMLGSDDVSEGMIRTVAAAVRKLVEQP